MVDTLDQDLDIDGEEEKKEKPSITSVGLKESIKNVSAKSDAKADDADEVQMEDPVSEDVKDDDEKKTNQANESSETKLAGSQLSQS